MNELQRLKQQRSLISLRRASIDANAIQCFVLGSSDQLVLLQYVYDFNLDGLMVLRTSDISDVSRSKTDELQERLLAEEGLLSRVPFGQTVDLRSWRHAITDLSSIHPLLILERELLDEPDLSIGRILKVEAEEVTLKFFTGAANWLDEPDRLRYDDITSCQANTNYVNVYQRHFERSTP